MLRTLSAAAAVAVAGLAIDIARGETQDASKPYTLYMGADVSVGMKNEIYPVWDVSGSSFVVKVNGQQVEVSPKDGAVNLKIVPSLKLTEVAATVDGLKVEQTYSPGSDPYTKFTRGINRAASDSAQSQFAANQANAQMDAATVFNEQASGGNPSGAPATAGGSAPAGSTSTAILGQQVLNAAAQSVSAANANLGSEPGLPSTNQPSVNDEAFDAIDVSFKVSAARPLEHPFVILIGRYRDSKNSPAGAYRNWIYAEALDPIDSKSAKVEVNKSGFPPGFQLKNMQVHVYNDGQEIATNVAANRVELSRADAFEYVRVEYIGRNKGATLPAVPAMGRLPADFPSRVAGGHYAQPIFVKVTKDGMASEVFADEACTSKLEDPYVASVVKGIFFKPALEGGQPVPGVAKIQLNKLVM